jgi:hypothetical protein
MDDQEVVTNAITIVGDQPAAFWQRLHEILKECETHGWVLDVQLEGEEAENSFKRYQEQAAPAEADPRPKRSVWKRLFG